MKRANFIKTFLGGAALFASMPALNALAAPAVTIEDNLGSGGCVIRDTAPTSKKVIWIDTSVGGVGKYWDGTKWKPLQATWA